MMPIISRGTSIEASMKTSELAQNASCCQMSCRKARFSRRQPPASLGVDHESRHHHRGHARDLEVALAERCRPGRAERASAWSRQGASRAATAPASSARGRRPGRRGAPPRKEIRKTIAASPSGTSRSVSRMSSRTVKIAIAVASLSRLSPSTRRERRAGAPRSRKIATTAAGSVVAMIAASIRQATSGTSASGQSARPTVAVVASTAITASTRIGAASSVQAPDVDRQRRLEQQDRQEDEQEAARGDREVEDQLGDLVEDVGQRRVQQEAGGHADQHADQREQHGVGQVEPRGQRLQEADQDQQPGDREQDMGQIQARPWPSACSCGRPSSMSATPRSSPGHRRRQRIGRALALDLAAARVRSSRSTTGPRPRRRRRWWRRSRRTAGARWRSPRTSPTSARPPRWSARPRPRSGRSRCWSTTPRSSTTTGPRPPMRERWQRHMAINLRAPLVLTQGLLAQPARGRRGQRRQPDRRAGAQPHPALHLLHGLQGGALGADPASRAGARAAGAGQRDRAGAGAAARRR